MGPPAGNVPLVAWPRVSADQAAGAISRVAIAVAAAARRSRPVPSARPPAATAPSAISSGTSQGSEAFSFRTTSSVITPPAMASGPATRASMSPWANRTTPAPTSAAVKGASSDT